jgi:meso-butanediol dehydrogenase / (S,S)-butanediol dehydrogenase / diacetyl reductase
MARFAAKSVVVTGAAGGLGRATALRLAREEASLVLTDVDPAGLHAVENDVRLLGARVVSLPGDATDPALHARLVDLAVSSFGAIDVLCNVAGLLGPGTIEGLDRAAFDRVMHVNCLAQMLAIQHAAPHLRKSKGAIVNVSSVGALVGLPLMSLYCASKAAVVGMTRAVAAELAPNVRCNALCPGGIDTPMSRSLLDSVPPQQREPLLAKLTGRQLIARFASPDEIAAAVAFLASPDNSFMTGAIVSADGGHTAW